MILLESFGYLNYYIFVHMEYKIRVFRLSKVPSFSYEKNIAHGRSPLKFRNDRFGLLSKPLQKERKKMRFVYLHKVDFMLIATYK